MNDQPASENIQDYFPIPFDVCHRCADEKAKTRSWSYHSTGDQLDAALMNPGIPVAVTGIETRRDWFTVRYICARCRQIWDRSFAGEGTEGIGEFEDRYLGSRENVKAYPQDGILWPAGPVERLRQEPPESS